MKNYHTIAPFMYCFNFKTFETITVVISSNLGINVFFFDSRDLLEIKPYVVDEVC